MSDSDDRDDRDDRDDSDDGDAAGAAGVGRDPLLVELGRRLRARRRARRLSVKALAARSALSARYLIQLEAGDGNASVRKLAPLARALDLPLSALLSEGPRGALDALLCALSPEELREAHALLRARFPAAAPMSAGGAGGRVVALLGVRGAGKSTVGRALAARLGWRFVELDAEVERRAGLGLSEIFALHGEPYYRRLEREALGEALGEGLGEALGEGREALVIATGGSLVTCDETFELLRARAELVWLAADAEEHWRRVLRQGDQRPMRDHPHAMTALRALLAERAPLYARAAHRVETTGRAVDEVVALVLAALGAP